MKAIAAFLIAAAFPFMANAAVEFTGSGWGVGSASLVTIEKVGIAMTSENVIRVVLNLTDGRQVLLTGNHVAAGLALTPYQGQCIKVVPGSKFESANFILSCK